MIERGQSGWASWAVADGSLATGLPSAKFEGSGSESEVSGLATGLPSANFEGSGSESDVSVSRTPWSGVTESKQTD